MIFVIKYKDGIYEVLNHFSELSNEDVIQYSPENLITIDQIKDTVWIELWQEDDNSTIIFFNSKYKVTALNTQDKESLEKTRIYKKIVSKYRRNLNIDDILK